MKQEQFIPLLIGEVFLDFTVTEAGAENKLRLGGVAHAARGFWASGYPFDAAVFLPAYLEEQTRTYFEALGCVDFRVLGHINGAPNVVIIFDAVEVGDQGYETLLRDEKIIEFVAQDLAARIYEHALIFPGGYDLERVCALLPPTTRLHLDVAYDVKNVDDLIGLRGRIETIFISTSSPLFLSIDAKNLTALVQAFQSCAPANFILKENRGGARLFNSEKNLVEHLPAQLGQTSNSVGVGDVFAAAYVANIARGEIEAAWRSSYAAAAYSQTTFPDVLKNYITRDRKLNLDEMRQLGGTCLPWDGRGNFPIYLAAPDFSYADRKAIDFALSSLVYHNFLVRRPIVENGELSIGSNISKMQRAYQADYLLLKECSLVFAIPIDRDPGTLVEIGIAIEACIPVVVYDPAEQNKNTMVVAGSSCYSANMDVCLNAVFDILSGTKKK